MQAPPYKATAFILALAIVGALAYGVQSTKGPDGADGVVGSARQTIVSEWGACREARLGELADEMGLRIDLRETLSHGQKPAKYQKYIVLHDTLGSFGDEKLVDWWEGNGKGLAAHFAVDEDGSVIQCVDLDEIAHHAGFGNAGNNARFGVPEDSRDDRVGSVLKDPAMTDYGMNSYSIGIELVHDGQDAPYPQAQLDALDALIAYLDCYYGFESAIIDHKTWRDDNPDTSRAFAGYLANYQDHRTHK